MILIDWKIVMKNVNFKISDTVILTVVVNDEKQTVTFNPIDELSTTMLFDKNSHYRTYTEFYNRMHELFSWNWSTLEELENKRSDMHYNLRIEVTTN